MVRTKRFRDSQAGRGFLHRQLFNAAQHEHGAEAFQQLVDLAFEQAPHLRSHQRPVRGFVIDRRGNVGHGLAFFESRVDRHDGDDGVAPGLLAQPRRAFKNAASRHPSLRWRPFRTRRAMLPLTNSPRPENRDCLSPAASPGSYVAEGLAKLEAAGTTAMRAESVDAGFCRLQSGYSPLPVRLSNRARQRPEPSETYARAA